MGEDLVLALFISLPCLWAWALLRFARRRRKQEPPAAWRQLVTGNALVLAFLLSVLLLEGEFYFRFLYDSTDAIALSKVSRRWFQRYWHLNALHVRDDTEYPLRRPAFKHRVTFVGDSFTAGHGIKDVNCRFVNLIRRAHPEWEVQMLAQPGLETGDELNMLNQALEHGYQFDEVVLVYYLNDISDLIPERALATALVNAQIDRSGWLRRNSYCIDYFCSRWQASRNPYIRRYFAACAAAYRGAPWQQQQQRLKAFRDVVQANGGRLCVVTFPFMHALGPDYEYRFVHEELDQLWRELQVPHLDLLAVYRGLPPKRLTVNSVDFHPNEYAHALAAAAIDKFLSQQLQTPSGPAGN